MDYIPYTAIPQHLGLQESDMLWVASDLSRLMLQAIRNEKKFDAEAFLDAFSAVIPNGTLLIPGFNAIYHDGDAVSFRDLKPDTGGLSSTAFKLYRKGVWARTYDPVHSFFVKGKQEALFLGKEGRSTFGEESAFAILRRMKGKFLAIDTRLQHSFTFAHYIEELQQVPYRQFRPYRFYIDGANDPEHWQVYEKKKGYDIRLDGLLPLLEKEGAARKIVFNGVPFILISLEESAAVIEQDIRHNHARNLVIFDLTLYTKQWFKSIR